MFLKIKGFAIAPTKVGTSGTYGKSNFHIIMTKIQKKTDIVLRDFYDTLNWMYINCL